MAGETPITVVGNLVADPELRYTPSGAAVANFRIASASRRYDSQTNTWVDADTLYLTCNVWRQAAENVAETLHKGVRVIVSGRLKQRSYETREGDRRTIYEVEVDEVGPSLRYASAVINRNPSQGGGGNQGYNGGGQSGGYNGGNQQNNYGGGYNGGNKQPSQGGGNRNDMPEADPWANAQEAGGYNNTMDEPPF
ncbi:single-stranded DNA-binding protein [Corynebacterium choanae]|uniref:Single-stranded DNA-binding protein n=1 Tax=Corynebacterium choanae TaxID=1862358 RepID=A0A3G6J8Y9_9CORY|nr:single-stranded DNA-binding protein [Corynebacterium choanae]AZA12484.1 Single-stranded DNA-binding protein [Corynebacterium choanae]